MLKPLLITIFGFFTFFSINLSSWADGDIYTWKDESGRVHFSQRAPKNTNAKKINVKNNRLGSGYGGADAGTKKTFMERIDQRKTKEEDKKTAAASKEAKDKRCDIEKRNLALIQGNVRTRYEMEDGTIRPYTSKELSDKRESIKSKIEESCGE